MTYLILVLLTLSLLVGFFLLTSYEASHGIRLFVGPRTRLDQQSARIEFIVEHVDLGAFARDEIRRMAGIVSHAVVHFSLQIVRTVERLLTRLVRNLRPTHVVDMTPRESTRPFV